MTGNLVAHYRILEKLGEGGMGIVYRARDTHLDRFIALKILPPEKVADPERSRRFVRETKAASALNHPNITTVYRGYFCDLGRCKFEARYGRFSPLRIGATSATTGTHCRTAAPAKFQSPSHRGYFCDLAIWRDAGDESVRFSPLRIGATSATIEVLPEDMLNWVSVPFA